MAHRIYGWRLSRIGECAVYNWFSPMQGLSCSECVSLRLNLDISSGLGAPISEAELRIDLI